ncbi:hypothetical protein [Oscillibacter sp.]|uniref:stage II sporulation protein M n=1 Tax=Oscillibacter sp. TaxID=1945593 RepID=UPI002636C5C7|nr:hypothetical protein [Oscillibacter sp.]MDD3347949.1 hypothetical protein [Oscillibacter sp.]
MNWKKRKNPGALSALFPLLLLSLFFFGGVVLGQVVLSRVPDATGEELRRYLTDYVHLDNQDATSARAVLSALVLYLRYPLLAFLLGFASVGVALLPCAALAFGFFLSYSVCCFTAAFGAGGVLLALSVSGIRCLVTLPCFFLLAVPSMENSAQLARASFGRGHRAAIAGRYGREWWLRFAASILALLAGMCVDLALSPHLLGLVLGQLAI